MDGVGQINLRSDSSPAEDTPNSTSGSNGKPPLKPGNTRASSGTFDDAGVSLPDAAERLSEVMLRELVYLQAERRTRRVRMRRQEAIESRAGVIPVDSPSNQARSAATMGRGLGRTCTAPSMHRVGSTISSPLDKVLREVEDALPRSELVSAIKAEAAAREAAGKPKVHIRPRLPITLAYELGSS